MFIPSSDQSREPLIRTKLSAPQLRPSLVSRPRLLSLMAEGASRALTLICAPAGYGKTTLLTEWISSLLSEEDPTNPIVCWLSLDEGDNDPARFLGYLIAAFENTDPKLVGEARSMLLSFPAPPLQTILAVLINNLHELPVPISLVLDDYQFITNPTIHEGVSFFLDRIPAAMHLVIATRSDPPLPLARLRARDQLVEVRADQLRFTIDEAGAFLSQVMKLSLSSDDLSILETRTEGWAAGLQMAALSIQGRTDVSQFIKTFSGSHRYILDYLAEEVLNRQSIFVQHFLMLTSILDRFCAPLCSTVIGESESLSRETLESLDHTNLFLIALDEERCWYRYHHLFADLLKARLLQSQPDLVPRLHLQASEWFESNGFISEAVQHAFSAQDNERAAGLIERYGPARWSSSDPSILLLASRLPPEMLRKRPKLGIYQAWLLIAQGQLQAAVLELDDLKEPLQTDDSNPELLWMRAFVALLSAYAAHQTGEQAHASLPDISAFDLISEQDLGLRNTADYLYAILLNRRGEFQLAGEILLRCIQRDTGVNGTTAISLAGPLLARVRMMQGRLHEAAALCQEYLQYVTERGKRSFYIAGSLNIVLGEVLYEWNDLEGAEQQIREGIQANEPWNNILMDAIGYSDLVNIRQVKGDLEGATETMQKLEGMLQGRMKTLDLEEELCTIQARLWLAKGDFARAGEWADQMQLAEPLDFLQGWGRVTLARVRLAQGRYAEAQKILEALALQPGSGRRIHRQIRIDLLLAIALSAQGLMHPALQTLESCFSQAEPGGYLRVFLDSGEPVRELLSAYLRMPAPLHEAYAQRVLEAFPDSPQGPSRGGPSPVFSQADLVEPLTPRELEVLRLMAAGFSNRQIAQELILAEGTVKFYVHTVLEKLQVHSRTQAIIKAKELNMI